MILSDIHSRKPNSELDFPGAMQVVSQCTIEHEVAGDFLISDLIGSRIQRPFGDENFNVLKSCSIKNKSITNCSEATFIFDLKFAYINCHRASTPPTSHRLESLSQSWKPSIPLSCHPLLSFHLNNRLLSS